jgi:ABC-type transport system involved in cytochrome bd biosynthesis fused ATPase/permease subunit
MSVNPLQLGSGRGKSRDIKIDGIDLFFAGNRLLTDASLTLAYGRRYGLVGNNGIGKSTLLRALSRREIAVPTHISILHVEQEVLVFVYCVDDRLLEMIHWLYNQSWMLMYGESIFCKSRRRLEYK